MTMHQVIHGDSLDVLRQMGDNSIDAIVTDPPYGLSNHRTEDVTDCLLAWAQGREWQPKQRGGFMGKEWDAWVPGPELWRECLRVLKPGGHLLAFAGTRTTDLMSVSLRLAGFEIRDMIMYVHAQGFPKSQDVSKAIDKAAGAEREVLKTIVRTGSAGSGATVHQEGGDKSGVTNITAPATPEAQQWAGWGSALKPSVEPITVARKPLQGTLAANVLQWGTGGLNIDAARVSAESGDEPLRWAHGRGLGYHGAEDRGSCEALTSPGRWPANLVHDGSAEIADGLGHAARFYYVAKASRRERDAGLDDGRNHHATVKPIALMEWLIKLVTPPGGVVLDPFAGSGTTGCAAARLGVRSILIEREAEYVEIARRRVAYWSAELDAAAD